MDLLRQTDNVFFASTGLDRDRTMRIVANSLNGADDGDLFLEMKHAEMLSFDDGRLKTATYDQSAGFGLRAIVGEADAFAHAGELSGALKRATETVSAVASGHSGQIALAPEAGRNQSLYSDANPLNQTAFEDKVALLQKIDSYARDKGPAGQTGQRLFRRVLGRRCKSSGRTEHALQISALWSG